MWNIFDLLWLIVFIAGGASVGASLAAPREDFSRTVEATSELVEWIRTRAPEVPGVTDMWQSAQVTPTARAGDANHSV